ncbi:response regulator [Aggregicoccus sp. 17bor-14]|uniref:response regulator n=1 Tax=Myxococcaceae TaxID=31 RepID=UPI00129C5FE9|nr:MULTISPECIES: response regulator [Myxococcaceae]MBF5044220.1 response regulator [Simulacricoccus sp. 17bor-14]MRI89970.1 response regulator [Aggregicoccus sp. 17bor-14]
MARLLFVEDNHELASLMAAAAGARGHAAHAVHSGEEGLAAARERGFDAAVVDLLLPDMRGGEVLAELRLLGLPAVAISGVYKGDRFAREAVEVHGARAFFEKPFELSALLESLERLVGTAVPPPEGPEPAAELEELLPLEESDVAPEPRAPAPPPQPSPPAKAPEPALPPAAPAPAALPLPFAERERVWAKGGSAPAAAAARPALPDWQLAGDLATTAVPRLLNAYYEARHGGELKLRQGQVLKVVYFEAGRPVYAASNLAQERFGRFCVRRGVLTETDLQQVAALCQEQNVRTGEAMVRLGLLREEQRRELLEQQVKEILWATFAWTSGSYGFSPQRPQRSDLVRLSVFPGDLILEGVLRTESLVQLRQHMRAGRKLFPRTDPPYGLNEFSLSGGQALLLAYADGSKTVEDLLTLTDLPEREALGTLRAFELLGLVEERSGDAARRRITFGL